MLNPSLWTSLYLSCNRLECITNGFKNLEATGHVWKWAALTISYPPAESLLGIIALCMYYGQSSNLERTLVPIDSLPLALLIYSSVSGLFFSPLSLSLSLSFSLLETNREFLLFFSSKVSFSHFQRVLNLGTNLIWSNIRWNSFFFPSSFASSLVFCWIKKTISRINRR